VAIKISSRTNLSHRKAWTGVSCIENVEREVAVMKYLGLDIKQHYYSDNSAPVNNVDIPSPTVSPVSSPRISFSNTNSNMMLCDSDNEDGLYPSSHAGKQYFAKLIGDFTDEHFHYVVTEFIEGGDMFNVLLQLEQQKLPEAVAKILFQQLLLAVDYLHSMNVAHLDLSLENICLRGNGNLAIIDFGLATIHPLYNTYNVNSVNNVVSLDNNDCRSFVCKAVGKGLTKPGKVSYMSPELLNGKSWDAYSNDLFSIGVVLYTMSVGKPPFRQAEDKDVWYHVISTTKWLTPSITKQSSASVYMCLSKDLLLLLDSLIKPQQQRATLQQLLNSSWL
jgi:serine/threonine protein kinase